MIALNYILEHDGTPDFCSDCPFGTNTGLAGSWNDPTESEYDCSLLGPQETAKRVGNNDSKWRNKTTVWGEHPLCHQSDWRERAKKELAETQAQAMKDSPVEENCR